ncbi:MFS transporter [Saxibacter everestensis]|uniref:MFS transporter n=1 Tax=Saxibacter everestensis TaxID=2909229 RepID=A0ABY8QTF4_9MICO|nr:MFS transporter [Brevibacteriaceae bacterium ZFBP1038]
MSRQSPRAALPQEIWVLVSAAFVIAIGFGLVAPALPQYARSFGVGITAASALISAFALMRLCFAPLSGSLVQRLGERPVYLLGLGIVALSTGACALAGEYWQLLLFRALGGIGSTMFSVSALGLLIRMSPPEGRGRVSGLYATSFLLGSISGPLIGAALIGFGLRVPFVIYAIALVIAAGVVFFSLRGSSFAARDSAVDTVRMPLRAALGTSAYRAALSSNFANGWTVMGVRVAMVPLFVVEALQQPAGVAGIALTVFALGNAAVMFQSGRLSDRFGRKPFILSGLLVSGLATIAVGFTGNIVAFLALTLIAGFGSGLLTPAQQASVADVIGQKARGGQVLATFQMVADVGAIVGPIVAGLLAEAFSYGVAFAASGVIMLLAAVGWLFAPDTVDRNNGG